MKRLFTWLHVASTRGRNSDWCVSMIVASLWQGRKLPIFANQHSRLPDSLCTTNVTLSGNPGYLFVALADSAPVERKDCVADIKRNRDAGHALPDTDEMASSLNQSPYSAASSSNLKGKPRQCIHPMCTQQGIRLGYLSRFIISYTLRSK